MNQNRRTFLKNSASAATAMMMTSFEKSLAAEIFFANAHKNFELIILGTNWGFNGSFEEFFMKAKAEGYDGAEIWCPGDEKSRNELADAVQKTGMKLGLLFGSGIKDPQKNFEEFQSILNAAVKLKPIYINCHTGKDFFSFEDLKKQMDFTTQLSTQTGIPMYHETHRGRALYSAPVAKNFIEKIPELRVTFDVSHWCNVHESLLEDQQETIDLVLSRVEHIHARIGHSEGPQVNDPRAPEWDAAVKAHFNWWDKVVKRKMENGERLTILTEFGPPNYMPTIPYTQQPLADQWAINVHMMKLLRQRYLK